MGTRVTKSLKIDPEIWKEMKKHCVDLEKEMSEYIEDLIKKDLKQGGSK
ncbi:MAG: hypothetical protein ACP5OG_05665 [Candidatus Nanoarchaeia archaeon]